uniref:Pre-rRNA-processing protein RIX1 N-terminal domain-containing protein n=1 Tax=Oryza meridionalis TaxID=40149 RepID=A0A0E0E1K5_9ORYZ
MASHIHAAAAGVLPLTGMHDLRLRPRLLRRVLAECLPLPDPAADLQPTRSPADLARALSAVREQGLLAVEGAADPGLLEEWSAAVDAWVDRLVALLASDREHSCWVGTSFLGLTFEECSEDRFANSYSFWFEKIMKKIKVPSSNKMVSIATCTTMASLFMRLAKFSNLKDEATLLAQKVVQPLLRLLDKDGSVAEKATDLLGLIMKLFPSSVYRHFNKKLASTLALLPCVRVSHNSLSLMIQKILIVVNNLLNGYTGFELMPLISPGSKPPPQSGGQTTYGNWNIHSAKKFCTFAVPTISALIHCCSMMLTTSYPIQVNIPVPAVVTFIQRVLLTDVTFHKSSLVQQDTPSCRLSFSEILELHSSFLDFLGAIIKGMRSSLLPHAGSVVTLITEYFKRAKLPAVRRKLYTIVQLLMSSMGVGMGMHLLQVVVSNISADLDDNSGNSLFVMSSAPIGGINQSSLERSSSNNQALHGKSSTAGSPTCIRKSMSSLCVKIAALEAFEVLLTVGGSFRACYWRTQMDLLLINVARESFCTMGMYELTPLLAGDPTLSDFQLALLKSLLTSFLSSPDNCPYLERGLELFNRGRLETGTELAKFCSHALLALDVLVHPREHCLQYDPKIPLKRAAHGDQGSLSIASDNEVLDSGRCKNLHSACKNQATENSGDGVNEWLFSTDDAPTDAFVEDNTAENHEVEEMSRDHLVQKDTVIREHQEIVLNKFHGELLVPTSSRTDADVAIAGRKGGTYNSPADYMDPGGATFSNNKDDQHGRTISGAASSSQNVTRHTAPICDASGVSGTEWDSLDPFLDIGNFGTETTFSLDMANLDPGSN